MSLRDPLWDCEKCNGGCMSLKEDDTFTDEPLKAVCDKCGAMQLMELRGGRWLSEEEAQECASG